MTRTALYRLYSADDTLLYIGITGLLETRFQAHAGDKSWWPEVTRKTVTWYDDRATAEDQERIAVQYDRPIHNIRHSLGGEIPDPPRPTSIAHSPWWTYVRSVAQGDSTNQIGLKLGMAASSVSRWKTISPKCESAVAFARVYGRPPLEALAKAEILTPEEAGMSTGAFAASSNDELATELLRRLSR